MAACCPYDNGPSPIAARSFDDFGPAAREAGVVAAPGITDSNLPGDLLANLAARRIDGPADIVISYRTRSGGEGARGSARTLWASLDWFRSGGWHYQDEGLRRGPLDRHTTMLFPGDTEETAVTEFPQPPVLTIPRHTPVRFVSGVLAAAEAFVPREFLDALAPHGVTWRIEDTVRR